LTLVAAVDPVRAVRVETKDEWNDLVAAHPMGHALQSWEWGELKSAAGWSSVRLATHHGSAVAAAQVLIRPLFGTSAVYVPRGPMFSMDDAADRALLQSVTETARRHRAAFLRIEPHVSESAPEAPYVHEMLGRLKMREADPLQPRATVRLDLRREVDELLREVSKGHRADVRRAERDGVTVRLGDRDEDLLAFHDIMLDTSLRKGFGIHARSYYRDVWRRFDRDAALLLADREDEVVGAMLIVGKGREALYLYGGATEPGLKHRATHALAWRAIQWAKEHGCVAYDQWGVSDAIAREALHGETGSGAEAPGVKRDRALDGIYRFKKGWGGELVRFLPAYDRVYLPPLYHLWLWRRGRSD